VSQLNYHDWIQNHLIQLCDMSNLSREYEYEFMEYHISRIWNELHDRFGFDIKKWKARFEDYHKKHPRMDSKLSAFNHFGYDEINPVLNKILCRNNMHPTFNNLVQYVINNKG